jgi:type IV secretory pathway VirB3-like protein
MHVCSGYNACIDVRVTMSVYMYSHKSLVCTVVSLFIYIMVSILTNNKQQFYRITKNYDKFDKSRDNRFYRQL